MGKNALSGIRPFLTNYKAELLISAGISGLIFSTVWNIKATVTATKLVEAKKKELGVDKLPAKEIIKTCWKLYIPSVASTAISIPCIILGNEVNARRNAVLAAAYSAAETTLGQINQETIKQLGPEKTEEIKKQIESNNVTIVGQDEVIFMDSYSGRTFKSTWTKIEDARNRLNQIAVDGADIITLTEWYEALGLSKTATSDDYGWSTASGRTGLIDIYLDASTTVDHKPICVVGYYNLPKEL